jgi:hypothetical protein
MPRVMPFASIVAVGALQAIIHRLIYLGATVRTHQGVPSATARGTPAIVALC